MTQMKMVPIETLTTEHSIAGAKVTGIRRTASGKTFHITAERPDGTTYTFPQQRNTRIAVVSA